MYVCIFCIINQGTLLVSVLLLRLSLRFLFWFLFHKIEIIFHQQNATEIDAPNRMDTMELCVFFYYFLANSSLVAGGK